MDTRNFDMDEKRIYIGGYCGRNRKWKEAKMMPDDGVLRRMGKQKRVERNRIALTDSM